MSNMPSDLRRSCTFCRQRKMKCSGESPWCKTCRDRCQPCIYETSAPKGRPKRRDGDDAFARNYNDGFHAHPHEGLNGVSGQGVYSGDALEEIFHSFWRPGSLLSARQETFRSLLETRGNTPNFTGLPYDGLLNIICHELTSTLGERISQLESSKLNGSQLGRLEKALACDDTLTMFEAERRQSKPTDPMDLLDQHRTMQLVEFAFVNHPFLTTIVSRTLFLKEYTGGTYDRLLLCVIVGEAIALQEVKPRMPLLFSELTALIPSADEYFQHAFDMLRARSRNLIDYQETFSTLQAVLLIAWHELCHGHIKRAIVYIASTSNYLTWLFTERGSPTAMSSRINGIPVEEIEDEMLYCMHWISQSLAVWVNLQLGTTVPGLWTSRLRAFYPPLHVSDSWVWKLDAISGYVSASLRQVEALVSVRTLAHVYGLISHMYSVLEVEHHMMNAVDIMQAMDIGANLSKQLHSCLPKIVKEAHQALPASHRYVEPFGVVKVAHEVVALHITLTRVGQPSYVPDRQQSPRTPISSESVVYIVRISHSLAEQAHIATTAHEASPAGGHTSRAAEQREDLLMLSRGTPAKWCSALLVFAIGTAARALEILLISAGVIEKVNVSEELSVVYEASPEAAEMIRQEAARITCFVLSFHSSLASESFACRNRKVVKRQCKKLRLHLEACGIQPDLGSLNFASWQEMEAAANFDALLGSNRDQGGAANFAKPMQDTSDEGMRSLDESMNYQPKHATGMTREAMVPFSANFERTADHAMTMTSSGSSFYPMDPSFAWNPIHRAEETSADSDRSGGRRSVTTDEMPRTQETINWPQFPEQFDTSPGLIQRRNTDSMIPDLSSMEPHYAWSSSKIRRPAFPVDCAGFASMETWLPDVKVDRAEYSHTYGLVSHPYSETRDDGGGGGVMEHARVPSRMRE